jgi:hypothetical protein
VNLQGVIKERMNSNGTAIRSMHFKEMKKEEGKRSP